MQYMHYDLNMENHMVSPMELERHYIPREAPPEKAAYAATERRLYRVPVLRARIAEDTEDLMAMESGEMELLTARSTLVQPGRGGSRRSPQEIRCDQMASLRASLAANERELRRMDSALGCIKGDHYYTAIEMKYFQGIKEADIAERLNCDPTTIRRNRQRLVKQLAFRLYGA